MSDSTSGMSQQAGSGLSWDMLQFWTVDVCVAVSVIMIKIVDN